MKNKDIILAMGCILIGFAYRLIPNHPPNFTPVAAMALVGGMYMNKRLLAFLAPLAALYIGDLILNNTILRSFFTEQTGFILWSEYMTFTYLAILATVAIGILLRHNGVSTKIVAGGLFSSVLFFLVTNFGSFLTLPMYPKTGVGLIACYEAAIPFFRNTLVGNYVFGTIFIGGIELIRSYTTRKEMASA